MTLLYLRGAPAQARAAFSFDGGNCVKALNRLWRSALVQQVVEVMVSMWRELVICAGALLAILILIIERG